MVRMGAIANCAKTVQGGNGESARKISIGAAARGALTQRKMHLLCERLRVGKKRSAPLALEGRAVESAGDLQAGPSMYGAQGMKAAFDAAHVR